MNEVAATLGPAGNLVSIVTLPTGAQRSVGVLILNAGVLPRVGPHRLSVKLARHLAAQGHVTVRFDFSGIGDSRAPRTALTYREQAVSDIRAVMDHLEREYRISAFALFGICAGADRAYAAALNDSRVAGVFMLDGYVYQTLRAYAVDYASRLRALSLAKLRRKFTRLIGARTARVSRNPEEEARAPILPRPPRERFAADMQSLVERDVRIAMLYSANASYRYAGQMRDAFVRHAFVSRIVCMHAPDIDHTVTSLAAQRRLLALVEAWVSTIGA